MNDPAMDRIERELRAMSEPSREPTELWKRALEISRAEERAGLVHPAADRARGKRGRRLLYTLNAVGVAALIALAAGVWTMRSTPPAAAPVESLAALAAPPSPAPLRSEPTISLFAHAPTLDEVAKPETTETTEPTLLAMGDSPSADSASGYIELRRPSARQRATDRPAAGLEAASPAAKAYEPEEALFAADQPPGLTQMDQALSLGLALGDGSASLMAFGPAIENAEIVVEVQDLEAASRALALLPDPVFNEFNSAALAGAPDDGSAPPTQVNIAPARMDETLGKIRALGRVVEENRQPDTLVNRARLAVDLAADTLAPSAQALQKVVDANGLDAHARAHRGLATDEILEIEAVRASIAAIARQLDEVRRSMNLSQIHVNLRQADLPPQPAE